MGDGRLKERLVFMGSPRFAVPALRALAEQFNIVAVVTQPDRPAGRGRRLSEPPVKVAARELGLHVWQPDNLRGPETTRRLGSLEPDCVVVAAYGEILRPEVLALAPRGFINVHASLLPRHRGASPIAAAILAGDDETGVTIMLLDEGMDTGPILAQERMPIREDDTRGSLEEKLACLGADLLARTLPQWLAGAIEPVEQDHTCATTTRPLSRSDGRIDWERPAAYIERQCRAMDPWPGAFTGWQGRLLKIWRGRVVPREAKEEPGTVVSLEGPSVGGPGIAVATGEGLLQLLLVQPEGRPRMTAEQFARGRSHFVGSKLESM